MVFGVAASSVFAVFASFYPITPPHTLLKHASQSMEALGLEAAARLGFVLVAGGLGERLGYSGIKVWGWGLLPTVGRSRIRKVFC